MKISAEKRYIVENVIIYTTEQTAAPLELAEIKRRWRTYIEQLPKYICLCDLLLGKNA